MITIYNFIRCLTLPNIIKNIYILTLYAIYQCSGDVMVRMINLNAYGLMLESHPNRPSLLKQQVRVLYHMLGNCHWLLGDDLKRNALCYRSFLRGLKHNNQSINATCLCSQTLCFLFYFFIWSTCSINTSSLLSSKFGHIDIERTLMYMSIENSLSKAFILILKMYSINPRSAVFVHVCMAWLSVIHSKQKSVRIA